MSITSRITSMEEHIEQAYDELQGLGADLTNVNKNIENISMVLDDIYDSMPQVSGEGTSLTLDDTRVGKIKSTLKGNTSQTGTPTPSSPIPVNVVSGDNSIVVCGKNLFDKDNANYVNGWIDGTTMRLNTINGNRMFYIPCKPNTTYTISRSVITSSFRTTTYDSTPFPTVTGSNVDYTVSSVLKNDSGTTLTITTGANAKYLVVHYGKIEDTNLNETLATIMVVKGNTAPTTYEPYIGNTYPIYLGVENLWDTSKLQSGFLNQSGSYPTTNPSFPNARYRLVYLYKGQSITTYRSTSYGDFRMRYIDVDTNLIVGTVGVGDNGGYCSSNVTYQGSFNNGTITALKDVILGLFDYGGNMAEGTITYGTKIQAISPTPIELCKIGTYQDYIYKDNGSWYLHKEIGKVVLNGSEEWKQSGAMASVHNILISDYDSPINNYTAVNNIVSSHFISGASYANLTETSDYNGRVSGTADKHISFKFSDTTSINDWKSWLSTHNVVVYYVLATPVNTALEDM